MTNRNQWFRFYSETLHDRKLERIARRTGQPRMVVIGAWSILLALANDSPSRGMLLLDQDKPWTTEDLADEFGCDLALTEELLAQFESWHMLHSEDGAFCITHWAGRQFASDSSTERVQQHRERRAATEPQEAEPEPCNDEPPPECNVTGTLQDCYGNTSVTHQSRAEQSRNRTETEQSRADKVSQQADITGSNGLSPGQSAFLALFGAKRFRNQTQRTAVHDLESTYGKDALLSAGEWAAMKGMSLGDGIGAVRKALPTWGTHRTESVTVKGL